MVVSNGVLKKWRIRTRRHSTGGGYCLRGETTSTPCGQGRIQSVVRAWRPIHDLQVTAPEAALALGTGLI